MARRSWARHPFGRGGCGDPWPLRVLMGVGGMEVVEEEAMVEEISTTEVDSVEVEVADAALDLREGDFLQRISYTPSIH